MVADASNDVLHDPREPLHGLRLRHAALAVLLRARRPLLVPEVLADLSSRGYVPGGANPSKALADALAVEVRRGRAVRLRRGLYATGRIPRTTAWRILGGSTHLR